MSFPSNNSIRVSKVVDRQGREHWKVKNTVTREARVLDSEAEVVDWIENSYSHTDRAARSFWFFM